MNIEASGFLSLFSELGGLENVQQTLLQDGVLPEQFTTALSKQLELLQQIPATMPQPEPNGRSANLQDFAALTGKNLPPVRKEMDIDLDATLQALAEVLKNIDMAGPVEETLAARSESPMTPVEPERVQPDTDSAVTEVGTIAQQPEIARQVAEAVQDVADALSVRMAPQTPPQEVFAKSFPGLAATGASAKGGVADESATMAWLRGQEAVAAEGAEVAEAGGESFSNSENNKRLPLEFSSANTAVDGDKQDLSRMAADIAVLNRSIIAEAKTEMAPMTRHFVHPQWGQELAERLVWMHKQAVPSAELNLNPRHLGPISIRVDVNQDQTTIAFSTQHAVVKEAIEAAIPRLREMLGAQQLNLVEVNVSQQQSEQKQANGFFQMSEQGRGNDGRDAETDDEPSASPAASVVDEIEAGRAVASNGILSIFA